MADKYISVTEFEKYLKKHIDEHNNCPDLIYKELTDGYYDGVCACRAALIEFPTADVQPVKRGYWKATMMSEGTGWDLSYTGGRDEVLEYNCSVCGKANILDEFGENFLPPYCPFCGADLREG